MAQDTASAELEIRRTRTEIGRTLDALAYKADIKARLPALADAFVSSVVSVATEKLLQIGHSAASVAQRAGQDTQDAATHVNEAWPRQQLSAYFRTLPVPIFCILTGIALVTFLRARGLMPGQSRVKDPRSPCNASS